MTWTFRVTESAAGSDDATTPPLDTSACDLLVALGVSTPFASRSFTDSLGNTWLERPEALVGSGSLGWIIYYCAPTVVGSGHTFTLHSAGHFPSMVMVGYSGADQTTPYGSNDSYRNSGAATESGDCGGGFTPGADNQLILSFFSPTAVAVTGLSINESYNIVHDELNGYSFGVASLAQTSATATNPTWLWTTSAITGEALIAFNGVAAPTITIGRGRSIP